MVKTKTYINAKTAVAFLFLCLASGIVQAQTIIGPNLVQPQNSQGNSLIFGPLLPSFPYPNQAPTTDPPLTPEQISLRDHINHLAGAAALALDVGHFKQAAAEARLAMGLSHDSAGFPEEILAFALEYQGKEDDAFAVYQHMVEDERATYTRILLPYALLQLKRGHWELAVIAYNKALPLLAEGDLMRSICHFTVDDPEPQNLATAIHIARGLTYNGEPSWSRKYQNERALVEYRLALQLSPNCALAKYYYDYGLKEIGRYGKANEIIVPSVQVAHGTVSER